VKEGEFAHVLICHLELTICTIRRKEADEIYTLAIARRVSPLEHIKARYTDFQKRMMCAAIVPAPTTESTPAPPLAAKRPALGRSTLDPAGAAPLPSQLRAPRDTASSSSSSNAPIQIYVDPTGAESAALGNEWQDLGSRKTRIKENVPEVKKFGGTVLKQKGKSKRLLTGTASSSSIVPFRDGEDAPEAEESRAVASSSKAGFVPFVDEDTTTSRLPAKSKPASSKPAPPAPNFVPFRDEVSILVVPPPFR
jgi:spindle assembly checkpoint component MAD3